MWLKASDIFKEALFHNTAPKFNINKHSKSRIGTERGKKQQEIKITSKGTVMWIKASDNYTEAFFHVSASKQIVVPVSFLIPLLNFAVMIIIIYKSSRIVHKIYAERRQN